MPDTGRIKVLVTGFGPFPGVPSNPSGALIGWIAKRHKRVAHDVELVTAVIPTIWTAVEEFVSGPLEDHDPDIVLHFGVHSRASGFQIEKAARNCAGLHADADGNRLRRSCVLPGATSVLRATVETEKLARKLRMSGLPASLSVNAGRYICNMLFFHSLNQSNYRNHTRQTGFIHIPPLAPASRGPVRALDKEALIKGAETIISHCISSHRHAMRSDSQKTG